MRHAPAIALLLLFLSVGVTSAQSTLFYVAFENSDTGQAGQTATTTGPVVYLPSYSGQARQLAEATTNLVYNYDLSGTYTAGLAQSCTLNNGNGTITVSQNTDPAYIERGTSSQKIIFGGNNLDFVSLGHGSMLNSTPYTWQLRLYLASGSVTVRVWRGSTSYQQIFSTVGWHRFIYTGTTDPTGSNFTYLLTSLTPGTAYIDNAQIEQKSYRTPLAGGDMPGHSWGGTSRASTSTRAASVLSYSNPITATAGTISFWWKPSADQNGPTQYFFSDGQVKAYYDATDDKIHFADGTNTISTAARVFSADAWQFLAFSLSANSMAIYENNTLLASGPYTPPTPGPTLFVGSETLGIFQANGLIDDFLYSPLILNNAPRTTDAYTATLQSGKTLTQPVQVTFGQVIIAGLVLAAVTLAALQLIFGVVFRR